MNYATDKFAHLYTEKKTQTTFRIHMILLLLFYQTVPSRQGSSSALANRVSIAVLFQEAVTQLSIIMVLRMDVFLGVTFNFKEVTIQLCINRGGRAGFLVANVNSYVYAFFSSLGSVDVSKQFARLLMERNCLLLLLNTSNSLHLPCKVHPCVFNKLKGLINEQMWICVREPLNIVGKGGLRNGVGLDKSVEQLLLNDCIKFTFDTSCDHFCISFELSGLL